MTAFWIDLTSWLKLFTKPLSGSVMELMGRQERGEMIEKLKAELEEFKNEKRWQKLAASSRGTEQPLSARQEELRRLYQANCKLHSGERLGAKLHALNPEVEGMRDYKSKRVKLQSELVETSAVVEVLIEELPRA
ncbi:hypothetical protein Efla_006811 [Eimeria flavescens]